MTTLGDLTKAINAQNVKLSLGASEMITIYTQNKSIASPRNRVNTRSGAADFASHPLMQVTFTAVVSKDLHTALEALAIPNSRGVLTAQAFTMVGQNIDGNSVDDITVNFTASVFELDDEAPENGWYLIRCTLVILNSTYAIS